MNFDIDNNRPKTLAEQLDEGLSESYHRIRERIFYLAVPKIVPGILPPTLEQLNTNIASLLDSVLSSMLTMPNQGEAFFEDIKSIYYETHAMTHLTNITYGLISVISNYQLCWLTLYMQKSFIFKYIENQIVRPVLLIKLKELNDRLNQKDLLEVQMQKTEEFGNLINGVVEDLMMKLDADGIMDKIQKIMHFEIENKASIINDLLSSSQYYVPKVLFSLLTNSKVSDTDISTISRFLENYTRTHSEKAAIELFKKFSHDTINLIDRTQQTLLKRNNYHSINGKYLIDGLNIVELKIAERIITSKVSQVDRPFINANDTLRNIEAIINKFSNFNSNITVEETYLVIQNDKGISKKYNMVKNGVAKDINDPFNMFKKNKWVRHTFLNDKQRNPLYQTGMTQREENELFLSGTVPKIHSMKADERVRHRKQLIASLVNKMQNNDKIMTKYNDIITNRIDEIKYFDQEKIKAYIIPSEEELLYILAEIDTLYMQILNDLKSADLDKTAPEDVDTFMSKYATKDYDSLL